MKICHVDPGCGLTIPPKNWGAIEKIVWEFESNQNMLGHDSTHKLTAHISLGEFDIVHCHIANLAAVLRESGIPAYGFSPMAKSPVLLHEHNEYIDIDVFKKGIDVYETLIGKLGSAGIFEGEERVNL